MSDLQERLKAMAEAKNKGAGEPTTEAKPIVTQNPVPAATAAPKHLFTVFYNTIASCKAITPKGKLITFIDGKCITDDEEVIEYLSTEMKRYNSRISQIKGQEQMTAEDLDPMAVLKKKHIAEYKKEQALIATGNSVDASTSDAQKVVPASTTDLANTGAESTSLASE